MAKEEKEKLLFYVEPLDPDTNKAISQMFIDLGATLEKKLSIKSEDRESPPTPVWECECKHAKRIVMAKEMLGLKFKIWLLSSDGKFLDRRGEFFFKGYL
ncbi:MAG: hypothetical protein WC849_02340 [Candidatus Paceibacterota bacterium]